MDRIERRREHIRTVSIYGDVYGMLEVNIVNLAYVYLPIYISFYLPINLYIFLSIYPGETPATRPSLGSFCPRSPAFTPTEIFIYPVLYLFIYPSSIYLSIYLYLSRIS